MEYESLTRSSAARLLPTEGPPSEPPLAHTAVAPPSREAWSQALWWVVELASLSFAVGVMSLGEARTDFLRSGKLSSAHEFGFTPWDFTAVGAAVGVLVLAAGVSFGAMPRIAWLGGRLRPLAIAGLLPALFDWRLWAHRDLPFLLYCSAVVFGFKWLVDQALRMPGLGREGPDPTAPQQDGAFAAFLRALPPSLPLWVVLAGAALYTAFFGYHTVVHHRNVLTASLDMGLEDNLVWNTLHGGPLFKSSPLGGPDASHLGYHATWFSFLLVPLYAIRPNAESLLVIQAALLGGAAIPLYLMGKRYVGPYLACGVALAYLLYPGLHGSNLYDFHYLPLGTFFIWFALYFVEARRWGWVVLFALLALSVREDVALGLGMAGGFLLLSGRHGRAGMALLIMGGGYFLMMKGVIMRRAMGGHDAFVHQYELLIPTGGRGFLGVVKTILTNPVYTLETLIEREKLVYLLQTLLPLAFFPLRRPIGLWCCIPGLLFTLLSTKYPPLLKISFQYTAYWSVLLFPAVLSNLAHLGISVKQGVALARARQGSWIAAMALASLATSHQMGALLQQNTARGGFGPYHFGTNAEDQRRRADLGRLLIQVPAMARIVATEHVVPQVSNRPDAYTLRIGVFDADYILFRLPMGENERRHVTPALKDGTFGVVDIAGEFILAKRHHRTEKNAEVLRKVQRNAGP